MASVGRPTKYDPSFCEKVIEYMEQGDSKTAVAARLGISKETLIQWCDENGKYYIKEFSDSIKKGMVKSQLFWEDLGKELVLAGQGNATAWIFNMKNRFKDDWSDITRTDVTTNGEKMEGLVIIKDNG